MYRYTKPRSKDPLSLAVNERLHQDGCTVSDVVEYFYRQLGFGKESSAKTFMSGIYNSGYVHSLMGLGRKETTRISTLLYILGFDENNPIVELLKKEGRGFVYPPPNAAEIDSY